MDISVIEDCLSRVLAAQVGFYDMLASTEAYAGKLIRQTKEIENLEQSLRDQNLAIKELEIQEGFVSPLLSSELSEKLRVREADHSKLVAVSAQLDARIVTNTSQFEIQRFTLPANVAVCVLRRALERLGALSGGPEDERIQSGISGLTKRELRDAISNISTYQTRVLRMEFLKSQDADVGHFLAIYQTRSDLIAQLTLAKSAQLDAALGKLKFLQTRGITESRTLLQEISNAETTVGQLAEELHSRQNELKRVDDIDNEFVQQHNRLLQRKLAAQNKLAALPANLKGDRSSLEQPLAKAITDTACTQSDIAQARTQLGSTEAAIGSYNQFLQGEALYAKLQELEARLHRLTQIDTSHSPFTIFQKEVLRLREVIHTISKPRL